MKLVTNYIKKVFRYIDFKFGRLFFKNDNNFFINVIGHFQLQKKICDYSKNKYSIDLYKNGFTKIDSFDSKELKFFSDKLENFSIENSSKFRLDLQINLDTIDKINDLLKKNKSLISTLNAYFKSNFIIAEINIYRNKYFKKKKNIELINENFHCDHYKKTMVKLFINLSEVKKENGPLEIFTKQNTKKIIQNGYYDRNNYKNAEEIIKNENLKFINIGKIGEALICATTECLHRASIPYPKFHRDMLAITLIKDFSKETNLIRFKTEINKSLSKKLGKLNFI